MKMELHKIEERIGCYPILLMINNECHIVLGGRSNYHYKWNKHLENIEKISKIEFGLSGLGEHGVAHIKTQNKLLLFGGHDIRMDVYSDEIWEYDMNVSSPSWPNHPRRRGAMDGISNDVGTSEGLRTIFHKTKTGWI